MAQQRATLLVETGKLCKDAQAAAKVAAALENPAKQADQHMAIAIAVKRKIALNEKMKELFLNCNKVREADVQYITDQQEPLGAVVDLMTEMGKKKEKKENIISEVPKLGADITPSTVESHQILRNAFIGFKYPLVVFENERNEFLIGNDILIDRFNVVTVYLSIGFSI